MASCARSRTGFAAFGFHFFVTIYTVLLHNLLFFQFALSLQFGDTVNFLGKQGVADIAVFQSCLVHLVGEVDIPCFTTLYQDNFGPPVFNSRRKADISYTQQQSAN